MNELPILGAILSATVLGVARVGLDHRTAIADLVAAPYRRIRRFLGLALWYRLGNGTVILVLLLRLPLLSAEGAFALSTAQPERPLSAFTY